MKNSTATIRVACAIVFLIFVFFYIYCFQTDILAFAQHVWSGGKTHWNGIVGASIITLILYLVHMAVNAICSLPKRVYALSFLPSFLLLSALTAVNPDKSVGVSMAGWSMWMCFPLLIFSLFLLKFVSGYEKFESPVHSTSILSSVSAYNFTILSVMMLLTFVIGNTDRNLHQRLKMERYVSEKRYDDALTVAKRGDGTDASMSMLCALSLSKKGELGEKLFEYPIVMSSSALLPATNALFLGNTEGDDYTICRFLFTDNARLWKQLGAYPAMKIKNTVDFLHLIQRVGKARPALPDYILSAYLMDGDLKGFASEITKYYDITEDKMPKHFKEALVLYTHLHSSRVLTYKSNILDADYEDFLKLERAKYLSERERDYTLRKAYFGTYWYYHYAKKMKSTSK